MKHIPLVICVPYQGKTYPQRYVLPYTGNTCQVMCSSTRETHIPSDRRSPTQEKHIPSDMYSPTQETHILSDMCSPTWNQDTHTYP